MSREIKFRAWRTDEKYMVTSDTGVLTALRNCYGNKGLAEQARFSNIDNQPNPNKFILMQYTGLKDKTGKEIYEGDILDTDLERPYLVVEFRNGCFVVECCDNQETYHDIMYPLEKEISNLEYHEVIGNIYENPELLK